MVLGHRDAVTVTSSETYGFDKNYRETSYKTQAHFNNSGAFPRIWHLQIGQWRKWRQSCLGGWESPSNKVATVTKATKIALGLSIQSVQRAVTHRGFMYNASQCCPSLVGNGMFRYTWVKLSSINFDGKNPFSGLRVLKCGRKGTRKSHCWNFQSRTCLWKKPSWNKVKIRIWRKSSSAVTQLLLRWQSFRM
jgi:hypothetical protein